ncbi:hypothetical protein JTE90_011944 [Oedothorax gibbosus]|uniref:C2H2-type domain-containing protein n=1 Tax=Oedothorax gibbosus TaxID=931172 RepID=A0AAV6V295_9ARAC|nr:hypothetical protein JTE90_011944 [Oedothorax gibbosus]
MLNSDIYEVEWISSLNPYYFSLECKLFYCDKCGRVFTSQDVLSAHQKRHRPDTTEKRHQCPLCPYATNYSSHLRQHTFTHSGERPHKCEICGAGFVQKSLLRKHMLSHEKKEGIDETKKIIKKTEDTKKRFDKDDRHKKKMVKTNLKKTQKICLNQTQLSSMRLSANDNNEDTGSVSENAIEERNMVSKKYSSSKAIMKDGGQKISVGEKIKKIEEGDSDRSTKSVIKRSVIGNEEATVIDHAVIELKKMQIIEELSKMHCERCSRDFISVKQLQKHVRMHRKEDKPHKCEACNKRYATLSALSRHEKKHYDKIKSSTKALKSEEEIKSPIPLNDVDVSSSKSLEENNSVVEEGKVTAALREFECSNKHKIKHSTSQVSPINKNNDSSPMVNKGKTTEIKSLELSENGNEATSTNKSDQISVKNTSTSEDHYAPPPPQNLEKISADKDKLPL